MKSAMSYFYRAAAGANLIDLDEALCKAAWKGCTQAVKKLLEAGADVHACKEEALEEAFAGGHTEIVKLLLEAGADARAVTSSVREWFPHDELHLSAGRSRSDRFPVRGFE